MGIETLLIAILPVLLKGIANAVESWKKGQIDSAALKLEVARALDDAKGAVVKLEDGFSAAHIAAFVAQLHSLKPAPPPVQVAHDPPVDPATP